MRSLYEKMLTDAPASLERHYPVPPEMAMDLVSFIRTLSLDMISLDDSVLVFSEPGFYLGLLHRQFEQEITRP